MPRRPQQLSVFYVAESDGLCFHLSQASPSQDLCEEHKWKESRLRMNERRWCPDVHSQSVSTVLFFFFKFRHNLFNLASQLRLMSPGTRLCSIFICQIKT